jgi:hypothetical protein
MNAAVCKGKPFWTGSAFSSARLVTTFYPYPEPRPLYTASMPDHDALYNSEFPIIPRSRLAVSGIRVSSMTWEWHGALIAQHCPIVVSGRGSPAALRRSTMIDRNSAATALAARSCIGSRFCYFDGFAALLRCQEYTQKAVRHKCLLVRHLSRWLEGRGLALERLDEEQLDGFLLDRHHRGKPRAGEIRTAHQILGYLRDLGCTPPRSRRVVSTPLTDLLAGFEKFLSEQRGLAPATLTNYLPIVRRFLIERFGNGSLDCCQLRASDIHHFILESLPGRRAKLRV